MGRHRLSHCVEISVNPESHKMKIVQWASCKSLFDVLIQAILIQSNSSLHNHNLHIKKEYINK